MPKQVDRRKFLRSAGATLAGAAVLGVGGSAIAAGPAGGQALSIAKPDSEPYKIDNSVYRPMSNAKTCFSRAYMGDQTFDMASWFGANPAAHMAKGDPGYTLLDYALNQATQAVGAKLSFTGSTYDYRGETLGYSFQDIEGATALGLGMPKYQADPADMATYVKKAARLFGADLVGVCRRDPKWVYSEAYLGDTGEVKPLDLPGDLQYAVVMAFEMDYDAIVTSPTCIAASAVAHAYSRQDSVALYVAEFIKALGYRAAACGNDTALSVPMAIDAGLGEFARSGMLVTPQFGPRVRLSKVFTDLPLAADKPISFGVREFCRVCKKCAANCPSGAITDETEMSWSGQSVSNNPGIEKWYVDVDKCLQYWCQNGIDCINCIATCPYNKPSGMWHHSLGALAAPRLGKAWVSLDDALGYGVQRDPQEWWTKEPRK